MAGRASELVVEREVRVSRMRRWPKECLAFDGRREL